MTITRFVCWHPTHGYLRFKSYSEATGSPLPDPRGLFARRQDAERRQREGFWLGGKPVRGNEIEVRELRVSFEVVDG